MPRKKNKTGLENKEGKIYKRQCRRKQEIKTLKLDKIKELTTGNWKRMINLEYTKRIENLAKKKRKIMGIKESRSKSQTTNEQGREKEKKTYI